MPDVNSAAFWDAAYTGETPVRWDLGGPTPVFQRLIQSGAYPPGRLLVLGAGRGHDAREFARHGFRVTAIDFSAKAAAAMQELMDGASQHTILNQDLFTIQGLANTFDYVLEYTCYCAIDPTRRGEYTTKVAELLKPGGTYIALAYPLDEHAGGPPFTVNADTLIQSFAAQGVTLVHRESPPDSVKSRLGNEELVILQKS